MKTTVSLIISVFAFIGCGAQQAAQLQPQDTMDISYQGVKSLCPLPEIEGASSSQELIEEFGLEEKLMTEGLTGWIHGSNSSDQLYVFTWRRPDNFFVNIQFPMSAMDPQVLAEMVQLKRHDRVRIRGRFMAPEAPLAHILVTQVEMIQAYEGPVLSDAEDYELGPLPESILKGREMVTKVHIAVDRGAVLVVEKDGWTIPVFNPEPRLAQDLYRNDKIFLKYVVRQKPSRPPHLEVDVTRAEPIEVVSRMVCGHGEAIELNGPLVMFPKSPQITLNVFALRTEDSEGIQQNFTFLTPSNGQDMEDFFLVNRLLQEAWDEAIASATYDRNKFINRGLQVRARGMKNVISPAQANPQIILNEIFINNELVWQK